MEMQQNSKANMNGDMETMNTKPSRVRLCDLVLRIIALTLTLIAAIIVGVDKQSKIVPVVLSATLPPFNVPVTAKWHYMSAFVYFVVSNAIACSYAAFSIICLLANRSGKGSMRLVILILDAVMVALLFSGNGAAAAIGVIGYNGNSHVLWNKVCNVFDKFCQHVAAGIALSLLGGLAFLVSVVLSALDLHKRSK